MLSSMKLSLLILAALAPFLSTAAIVNLYADTECTHFIQQVNVKDNTCASWPKPGWASYKLMTRGGPWQVITSYPRGVCVYPGIENSCVWATESRVGVCAATVGYKDGLSHAIGSSIFEFCPPF